VSGGGDSLEGDRWVTLSLPDQPGETPLVITDPPDSNALHGQYASGGPTSSFAWQQT